MAALLASLLQISITIGLIGQAVAYYVPPPEPIDNTVYIHWLKEPISYKEVQIKIAENRASKAISLIQPQTTLKSPVFGQRLAPTGINEPIEKYISIKSAQLGLDVNLMLYIAWRESQFNPTAKNPKSSASGIYQIIKSTFQGCEGDVFNAYDNIDCAAKLMKRDGIIHWRADAKMFKWLYEAGYIDESGNQINYIEYPTRG